MKAIAGFILVSIVCFSGCKKEEDPVVTPSEDLASLIAGSYIGVAKDSWGPHEDKSISVSRKNNNTIHIAPEGTNIYTSEFDLVVVKADSLLTHTTTSEGITFKANYKANPITIEFIRQDPQESFTGTKN